MLTIQHMEEDLSRAFVQAIAAKAGVNVSIDNRSHDYGIDGTFHQISYIHGKRTETGYALDFQLKASRNVIIEDNTVKFDLAAETYNCLVERSNKTGTTPAILIVLSLPEEIDECFQLCQEELILRRCCYWIHLSGEITENSSTKRVEIPKTNFLTPEEVTALLVKIESGEEL